MGKGIFIEWTFWRDINTTISEKVILLEIQSLSILDKGCIAHNEHFSKLMGIKKEAVSRLINSLVKKGYISSTIKDGSRNFSRTITINKLLFDPKQNVILPLTNCLETKENKTINKTINSNFEKLWAEYGRVGSKYKASKLFNGKSFKYKSKEVEKAIKRYLPTVKDTKYKKHFSTFLNSLSDWLEDYEEEKLPTSDYPGIDLSQYE